MLTLLDRLRNGTTAPFVDALGRPVKESVASLERLVIGGVEQSLLVRGRNATNPVLLYLHGGPGTSELGMVRTHNMPVLEQHFVVAIWDQRGAGKSFAARRPEAQMTVEQLLHDTLELTELLCSRFGQRAIYLVGHSWGSLLGVLAAQRRPELYRAYVGVGQAVAMREGEQLSYDWALDQARRANDTKSVRQLEEIGPPPYAPLRPKLMTQRRILAKYGGEVHGSASGGMPTLVRGLLAATEYGWLDRVNVFRGVFAGMRLLWPQILELDLRTRAAKLELPVYFLLGRHDWEAPAVLAEQYFERLRAPRKQLVWFERSAHFVNTEEADAFNRFFVDRLLPETRAPAELVGAHA